MTEQKLIEEIKEKYSEWIEMSEDPDSLIIGILAKKVINLTSYIEYLEKRIKGECNANSIRY